MTTKYETWVDEVNSKCRFYLFWERSNAGYKINDICVSVTTVINTMLKNPVWDMLQKMHGPSWSESVTEIGTQVHILMELYLHGDIIGFNQAKYVMESTLKDTNKINKVYDKLACLMQSEYAKPVAGGVLTEKILRSKDVQRFAGAIDYIDTSNNVLRDWKSGVYTELTLHHKFQLSAYIIMARDADIISINDTFVGGVTCTTNPQNKFYKCTELNIDNSDINTYYWRFVELYDDMNWDNVIDNVFNKPTISTFDMNNVNLERKKNGRISLRHQLENERNFTI